MRDTDGVHFTDAGYVKLAHFVERELKRDITQARTERSIPLAGDTAEQARVNPDKVKLKAESARAEAERAKSSNGGSVAAPAADGVRDQKAESGKVDIRVPGKEGTEEVVTVEIVRPAIPASIVALVTRKQSDDRAAQMGDVLVDQIPGGLTVMSSIMPPRGGDGSRRRMSPTQTPYFRVLEKGERLPSKPGRADDFTWPRPQATAEVQTEPPPMPADAPCAEASSTDMTWEDFSPAEATKYNALASSTGSWAVSPARAMTLAFISSSESPVRPARAWIFVKAWSKVSAILVAATPAPTRGRVR